MKTMLVFLAWFVATPMFADSVTVASAMDGVVRIVIDYNATTRAITTVRVFNDAKPAATPIYTVKTTDGLTTIASGNIPKGNSTINAPPNTYFMVPDKEKPWFLNTPFRVELNVPFGEDK